MAEMEMVTDLAAHGLTQFGAVMLAEGVDEPANRTQLVAAWQYLVNSGLAWSLQGWFGRTAMDLIQRGIIGPPGTPLPDPVSAEDEG